LVLLPHRWLAVSRPVDEACVIAAETSRQPLAVVIPLGNVRVNGTVVSNVELNN
jgi:RNA-binding protein YlmH